MCRMPEQHMAHPAEQQMVQAQNANALQPPAQHMMQQQIYPEPQPNAVPSAAFPRGPEPMASAQIAPSLSTDMDMDMGTVDSSAESVIALQVWATACWLCLKLNVCPFHLNVISNNMPCLRRQSLKEQTRGSLMCRGDSECVTWGHI